MKIQSYLQIFVIKLYSYYYYNYYDYIIHKNIVLILISIITEIFSFLPTSTVQPTNDQLLIIHF